VPRCSARSSGRVSAIGHSLGEAALRGFFQSSHVSLLSNWHLVDGTPCQRSLVALIDSGAVKFGASVSLIDPGAVKFGASVSLIDPGVVKFGASVSLIDPGAVKFGASVSLIDPRSRQIRRSSLTAPLLIESPSWRHSCYGSCMTTVTARWGSLCIPLWRT
jgi:hypothetical protein